MSRQIRPGRARARPGRAPRRYHHGNLRRALIDSALCLVEREGVEALTLRGAARRAGVSQAAPYRHFRDKEALLAAVAEDGFRTMTKAMRRATERHEGDPLARFQARGLAYIEFATSHPAHFKVMFGSVAADRSKHPGLMDAAQEAFKLLVAAVRDCQLAGLVRGGPPEELALCAWSATHGLAALAVDGQLANLPGPLNELGRAVTTNVYIGLGPR